MSQIASLHTVGMDYEAVKAIALKNSPVVMKANWSDLEIGSNGELSIRGQAVRSDGDKIQRQLLKVMGLSKKFFEQFGNLTNAETQKSLIQLLQNGLQAQQARKGKGDNQITLLGNPIEGVVMGILPSKVDYIPSEYSLKLYETLANKYPFLSMFDFTVQSNGDFSISVIARENAILPKPHEHIIMRDEPYHPGFIFRSTATGGVQIDGFMERIICTNGLIDTLSGANVIFNRFNENLLANFMDEIDHLAKNNFMPVNFDERLTKAMETPASIGEIMEARRQMKGHSSLSLDEDLNAFLPEFNQNVKWLAQRGFDIDECTTRQLENCPAYGNVKVWDVVNRMTDFGSHNFGYDAQFVKIQAAAGRMLNKTKYDTENLILLN